MDKRLLDKLKQFENKNLKILDVGGWFAPCKQATHLVDIMSFDTVNWAGGYGFGDFKITKENYFQIDLCNTDTLPFKDKEFDYVICRHTLEDLKDPINVCKEIIRVGKAGYIEVPSRVCESTKGIERPYWCGYYHHRWLIEINDNKIMFQFKPHNLHSNSSYYFRRYPWMKMKKEYMYINLFWEKTFSVEEKIIIDYYDVINNLKEFKKLNKDKKLFYLRWLKDKSDLLFQSPRK